MTYGVTSSRAHLDTLGGGLPGPDEINWAAVGAWHNGVAPAFAGRYFLGTPTQPEVDLDLGFCLWAHGEGGDPAGPAAVVPLQRSEPDRQQATGTLGAQFGAEDARAVGAYLERCAGVGDLVLPLDRYYVLVFLEVDSGVAMSVDYWSMWAHTVEGMVLDLHPQGLARPLKPAIACAFEQAAPGSLALPEASVQVCLSQPAPAGRHRTCYGFWCRTVLTSPVFGEFVQDPVEGPVPVRYRRTFDGPGGSPNPPGVPASVLSTLPLITVDEPVPGGPDDPLQYALEPRPWNPAAPPPPDSATPPANLPTQFGVDLAYPFDTRTGVGTRVPARKPMAECMGSTPMLIRRLPAGVVSTKFGPLDLGTWRDGADALSGRPSFCGRYLAPHFNWLAREEAFDIFVAGMAVVSIWQLGREMLDGFGHALQAFAAAEALGQPPHTPIYFATDVTVDDPRDPDSPSMQRVTDYYRDVRRGYRQYRTAGGSTPYHIGAYGPANVLDMVYRGGLATHFWQPWPPNWGPPVPFPPDWTLIASGWRAWPHLNAWQILLGANSDQPALIADNRGILSCVPANDLDLNVAWGDPGSWFPP
ncbi:glycoside hydrolase domain-containing protein [Micromonospora chokoriensis]